MCAWCDTDLDSGTTWYLDIDGDVVGEDCGCYADYAYRCLTCSGIVHSDVSFSCYCCGDTFCANHVTTCSNCQETWGTSHLRYHFEDSPECEPAHVGPPPQEIARWNWRPKFDFLDGKGLHSEATPGVLYMGIEVEAEQYGTSPVYLVVPRIMRAVQAMDNPWANRLFIKEDGSLNSGIEVVTYPGSPEAYAQFPWPLFKGLIKMGFRGYDSGRAGVHIHVARSSFLTKSHMMRFLLLQYRNPQQCMVVGQRGSTNYSTWTSTHQWREKMVVFVKGERRNANRYTAVNLQNEHTIELRYFRSNLRPERIKKNVQWVQALFEYTKDLTYRQVRAGGLDWPAFRAWLQDPAHGDKFRELLQFLSIRGEL